MAGVVKRLACKAIVSS